MALVMLATILASYHSHAYGPLLLTLPTASMLAQRRVSPATGLLLVATAVVPTILWIALFKWYMAALAVLLVASFGALLLEMRSRGRLPSGLAPAPAQS